LRRISEINNGENNYINVMKRTLIILALVTSFSVGFAFNAILTKTQQKEKMNMKRVTGIGGIFFKCKDPNKMKEWYKTHLGFDTNEYGAKFDWHQGSDSTNKGYTLWSPFADKTKYFEPSTKDFMINYRVENLVALVEELKKEGVEVLDDVATYEYGKFVHILDLEGNKIELWEPAE
jgi:predicted enzyme related to lactoylglutathione lyase